MDRNDVFWWLYVASLAGAALYLAHSFVGLLVLGLFGYYATRPISARFETVTDSKGVAAALTVLTVLIPVLLLTLYVGVRMFQQIQRRFDEIPISLFTSQIEGLDLEATTLSSVLRDPPSLDRLTDVLFGSVVQEGLAVLDMLFGTLLLLALAVTLSYALLVYDDALSEGFAKLVGGRDETVYSYALAVDTDLESIFFGNLLFVLVMSVVATATYALTNLVAPSGLRIPMVFTLGVLTGLTSIIPIVVGKLVYVPIVAYLALSAMGNGEGQLVFVGGALLVYFLVLDILPQSFLQPYISGRQLNPMLLLFAYILGPILFGWYGFFFLPIVFVLIWEMLRIVLPELLHGEPIVSEPLLAEDTGASSEAMHEDGPDSTAPGREGADTDHD